jgi:hypothetical protein
MDHDFAVRLERDLAEEKAAWDDHKKALDTGDIKAGLEAAYRLRRRSDQRPHDARDRTRSLAPPLYKESSCTRPTQNQRSIG